MALVNEHFLKLPESYLYTDIARRVNAFRATHRGADPVNLGIGDVTLPLPPACVEAMREAVEELGRRETFRGYGPERGYDFLTEAILKHDYAAHGIRLGAEEIFVNDGAKGDTGSIGELLRWDNSMAVPDPAYPVYAESNILWGRSGQQEEGGAWSNLTYLPCTAESRFVPHVPDHRVDLVYLCSPGNPTGTALTRAELKQWVDYALENDTILIYDGAYESYVRETGVPRSIYEIRGARRVAVEIRSFSKTAGFTGVRCGYTVIPRELTVSTLEGERIALGALWARRQSVRSGGTGYVAQRGAAAVYTPEGQEQVRALTDFYLGNARFMREELKRMGLEVAGGENAPYLWLRVPEGMTSWRFFDRLLYEAHVVSAPGCGFGPHGEGYLRLTAFNSAENCREAMRRIRKIL